VKEPVAKYLGTHEFIKALKKRYGEEGIEISGRKGKYIMEKK